MRKLIVDEWMALDGVVQGPSSPDEDSSGGFEHGGWHMPYFDERSMEWTHRERRVRGRLRARTPHLRDLRRPLAERRRRGAGARGALEHTPEIRCLENAQGAARVAELERAPGRRGRGRHALKEEDGADLHLFGSTELVQTLLEHDLVDELRLMIDPVVVGGGKRLFRAVGTPNKLRLVESEVTSTGAILTTYARPDG
jgi:RibD C-terminal domain